MTKMPDDKYVWKYEREWLGLRFELIGTDEAVTLMVSGDVIMVVRNDKKEEGDERGVITGPGDATDSGECVRPSEADGGGAA